jgi:chromosome segregation ATPase
MNNMQDTIREYEAGRDKLRGRIDELNEEIASRRTLDADSDLRELEGRRYHLYGELAHMEESIAEMQDYLAAVSNPGTVRMHLVRRTKYA